ncbi:MAG: CAP domain-containing protein [Candidatus Krumholzibacteriia bacterium]
MTGRFPTGRSDGAAIVLVAVALAVSLHALHAGAGDRRRPRYLSRLEAEVVREINRVRTGPAAYAGYLEDWLPYYKGEVRKLPGRNPVRTIEGPRAVTEAVRYLRTARALHRLEPSRGMSRGARDHVRDMGPSGALGHKGFDDSTAGIRVNRYGKWNKRIGENIAYGGDRAREIVIRLIIDDGVPGRGHRHNLFDPEFYFVGVSFGPHKTYETMCVITLAGDYTE